METYTCKGGWRRHILDNGTEIVEGWRFTPAPGGRHGVQYPVAETPERAQEIARQRGEDVEAGKVVHMCRDGLGDCWRPTVCLREDIREAVCAVEGGAK
jgi:hypothetical protein